LSLAAGSIASTSLSCNPLCAPGGIHAQAEFGRVPEGTISKQIGTIALPASA